MTDPSQPEFGSPAWWEARYQSGATPWNTGIVPPEVPALIRTGEVRPGWALDLGCGAGVTSRYLARQGFHVVGVDLAVTPLALAWNAAENEQLSAWFLLGDAANLSFLTIQATLAIDIGCCHVLPPEGRRSYAASLATRLVSGAHYLLYAFAPLSGEEGPGGIGPAGIADFAPWFSLQWAQHGHDGERRSIWYLFRRG